MGVKLLYFTGGKFSATLATLSLPSPRFPTLPFYVNALNRIACIKYSIYRATNMNCWLDFSIENATIN